MLAKSLQSCPTLCKPMDYSPPGSSVHGILQARNEWVALPSSRGSSRPWIEPVSLMSPELARGFFTTSATWEALRFIRKQEGGLFLTQVLKPNNHHEGLCVQRLCFLLEDFASGVTRQFWAQWCCSRPWKLTDLLFSMSQVQAPHDIWLSRLLAASRGGSLAGQDSLVMPPYHPQTVFRLGVKLGMVPREADIWYQEKDSWKGECRQVTHSEAPWRSASSQFFLRLLFILPLNRLEQERIWRKDVSGTLKVLIPDQMGKCQNVIIISNICNIWLYVRYYSKDLTWMLLTPSLIE